VLASRKGTARQQVHGIRPRNSARLDANRRDKNVADKMVDWPVSGLKDVFDKFVVANVWDSELRTPVAVSYPAFTIGQMSDGMPMVIWPRSIPVIAL
jgi:hypothetical protein